MLIFRGEVSGFLVVDNSPQPRAPPISSLVGTYGTRVKQTLPRAPLNSRRARDGLARCDGRRRLFLPSRRRDTEHRFGGDKISARARAREKRPNNNITYVVVVVVVVVTTKTAEIGYRDITTLSGHSYLRTTAAAATVHTSLADSERSRGRVLRSATNGARYHLHRRAQGNSASVTDSWKSTRAANTGPPPPPDRLETVVVVDTEMRVREHLYTYGQRVRRAKSKHDDETR